jgi:hypothetical protein
MVQDQPGLKVHATPSKPLAGCSGMLSVIPAPWRNTTGGL